MAPRVIVVGGGLSGLSAAHTVYLNGGNVLVLDKQSFFGGNSTKATSGINGALTRTQTDLGIQDSVKQFYEDTLKSARDKARPDLIKVLTYKSSAAVEWLQDVFNLDLTLVSRLGGHSFPRTHRGHDAKFPGMAITYALMQRLEELTEAEPERVQVIKKARVTAVNKEGNHVTGVTYEVNGETHTADGVVILATGGYAADFTEDSLLKKHRPDTFGLSSTNGTHATGDGQKMLMAIGANGIDMDKVQVHPTGLIDPKDPTSKWKFLAAEALRGEGGLLLNSDGERFSDELGHRDYVSGQMWKEKEKKKWPIRLVLNSKASNVLDFHTRHYSGRGLMKKMTGKELAKEIGCGEAALKKTFDDYNLIAEGKKKDPWGKKFFHNLPFSIDVTNPDRTLLYVNDAGTGTLLTYNISAIRQQGLAPDQRLELVDSIAMHTAVDNIDVDKDGTLWVGAHPKFLLLPAHLYNPAANRAMSQVLRVRAKKNGDRVKQVYLNEGDEIAASSVGVYWHPRFAAETKGENKEVEKGGHLLIGAVVDNWILHCHV